MDREFINSYNDYVNNGNAWFNLNPLSKLTICMCVGLAACFVRHWQFGFTLCILYCIFAAIIGIVMFSDAAGWLNLFEFYGTHPVNLTALIVSAAAAVLFIVFVPKKQQHNIQTKSKDDHKEQTSSEVSEEV